MAKKHPVDAVSDAIVWHEETCFERVKRIRESRDPAFAKGIRITAAKHHRDELVEMELSVAGMEEAK